MKTAYIFLTDNEYKKIIPVNTLGIMYVEENYGIQDYINTGAKSKIVYMDKKIKYFCESVDFINNEILKINNIKIK